MSWSWFEIRGQKACLILFPSTLPSSSPLPSAPPPSLQVSQRDILNSIEREMSGDLQAGFKTVVMCVRNRPQYFAERLYKSMKGAGTDDDTLVRVVVSRAEVGLMWHCSNLHMPMCASAVSEPAPDHSVQVLLCLCWLCRHDIGGRHCPRNRHIAVNLL